MRRVSMAVDPAALKEQWRAAAAEHGFEFFGVVDADGSPRCRSRRNRCLDVPEGFLPGARSVIVMGMHIWDLMQNAVVTSVLPDGAIPFDDVPGSQYYNMYYEITEARAHRFAEAVRDAGYRTAVTHFVHAKAAATLAGLGWIGKQTLCITPQLGPHVRWCVRRHRRGAALRRAVHRGPLRRLRALHQGVPHAGHHPRPVTGSGARQEGRLLEVHRAAGDAGRAQQGLAEVGRALLAARQPRVPHLPGRLPGRPGRARAARGGRIRTKPAG